MKRSGVWAFLLLQSTLGIALAQDHCPPNGQTKTGSNPSVSWTSYMVKTPSGICVERSVKTHGRTYVNWPAADMEKIFVDGAWSTKRCCFEDSSIKDADLEYGVLGSKLHTAVYQGDHELAGATFLQSGAIVSGNKVEPVSIQTKKDVSTDGECKLGDNKTACKVTVFTITNRKAQSACIG